MPLSDEEERILRRIELDLYDDDPMLFRSISDTPRPAHHGRRLRRAAITFAAAVGLVACGLGLQYSMLLVAVAVAGLLAATLYLEQALRPYGTAVKLGVTEVFGYFGFHRRPYDSEDVP